MRSWSASPQRPGLHMGQWLSVPMIVGGFYLDDHRAKTARAGRADRGFGERRLSGFREKLVAMIRAERADQVERYMALCNDHYYATRDPLGAGGDFTTAPEISQMFGEMIGAALADCWQRAGSPADAVYVELGPGRGTLAADALRVMAKAGLQPAVHFVETSPALREAQAKRVPGARWHDSLDDLPAAPIVARRQRILRRAAGAAMDWRRGAERGVT